MSYIELRDHSEMVERYISGIREFVSGNDSQFSININGSIPHPEFPRHSIIERVLRFSAERFQGGLRVHDIYLTPEFSGVFGAIIPIVENSDKFKFVSFVGVCAVEMFPFEKIGYKPAEYGLIRCSEVWKMLVPENEL